MIKRPMKGAAVEDLAQVQFPCYAFPKVDGFRCVLGQAPMTSRLSPFPNKHLMDSLSGVAPPNTLLDGELVVGKKRGKGVLQRTSSGVTSRDGEPDFTLWVFDCLTPDTLKTPFQDRYKMARMVIERNFHQRVRILRGIIVHNLKELKAFLKKCLKRGFEGIVTRKLDGPWKDGKSTLREQWMLKVKPFEDAEGTVIGFYEEEQNTNEAKREATGKLKRSSAKSGKVAKGTLGGLILRDVQSGVEVRVGGGYTHHQRKVLWTRRHEILGELVKYKKQSVGEKDKPRHPNFVEFIDFRPPWDMTE